jgi:hypothetical protein
VQTHKPIILNLPKILVNKLDTELHKNLPKFSWKKIYFYYLIYYVSEQQIKQKNKEYCSLDSAYLKNVTVSNVHRYIKYLKDVQVFISDGHFTQGKKSYYYKINESFLVGDYCKIEINPADKLFSKIHQQITNQKAHVSRLKPHLKEMRKELMNIKIDHVNAFKWISENTTDGKKKFSHITSIEKLKDKRLRYFNRNKTNNRLDTNLTNLKSELKQFIIGDYTSIDLCNSQPFLLSTLLNNIINNNSSYCCYLYMDKLKETFGIKRIESVLKLNQNQEKCNLVNLSSYSNSVINGTLYDDFIIEYNGNLTRKEVKNIMFGVLFSGNVKPNSFIVPYAKEKKVFASVYPFIYDCIFNLKHNDKENNLLPIYLQKLESYLFIDCIAKELVNNNIVPLTIHDSVIVANKDVETTLCIIKSIFNKELGVIPSFSIEAI